MSSVVGQRVGEVIITALWPLIWVLYVFVSAVIIVETAVVYVSWGPVAWLDRLLKKSPIQTAD